MKKNSGITLIALVVTIIVLLILAGVTISLVIGQNGIVGKAKEAQQKQDEATRKEQSELELLNSQIDQMLGKTFNETKKVNEPVILTGMNKIMFADNGDTIKSTDTNFDNNNWYDYENKRWANSMTQDGSMWVWIPRFAYKLDSSTKSSDVKFLIGTSNKWYNPDTKDTEDLPAGYLVAPCFQDGRNNNFKNGEWDKELTGIWVAKFAAGFASGNNTAPVKSSSMNYTQKTSYVASVENEGKGDTNLPARNWLDGEYGETPTAIKYPTFQGNTYAMNYINVNDAYNISKALTEEGNIYGLSSVNCDSHLMKNSEWGAMAYLSCSQYGRNGEEITINNTNLNNSVKSVYAVTGGNNYKANVNQSSTNNMYGVYDMNGCVWERTAAYVANENSNLKTYGKSIAYDGDTLKIASTKYTTVYPHDADIDKNGTTSNIDQCSAANYSKNTEIYGDAVRETSTKGDGFTSWNGDSSYFPGFSSPLFVRGGAYGYGSYSGAFTFGRNAGYSHYNNSYRSSLVSE